PRRMFTRDRFEHSVGHQLSISAIFWNSGAVLDRMLDFVLFPCVEHFVRKVVEVVPFLFILRSSRFHEYFELALALLDPDAFDPSKCRPNEFEKCELQPWQLFAK